MIRGPAHGRAPGGVGAWLAAFAIAAAGFGSTRSSSASASSASAPASSSSSSAQVRLGNLTLEWQWDSSDSTAGPLDHPMAVAIGADGALLVADTGNLRIVVVEPGGGLRAIWSLPERAKPVALAVRDDGTVLVADYSHDRVLVLGRDGEVLASWGTTGTEPGQLRAPSGLATTPSGTVIVVEFMGQRAQEIADDGSFIRFIDGGNNGQSHAATRRARAAAIGMSEMAMGPIVGNPHRLFAFPTDVAVSRDGTIYVSNTHAYEILVFETSGDLRTAWGSKGAAAGRWEIPVGLTVDGVGNLYVADSANFRVQVLSSEGHPLLVSRAEELWYPPERRLYSPTDLAIDASSQPKLYIADFAGSKIQRFSFELGL